MKRLLSGDTLIEVLFAFAILALVISVMFSGAMGSYKSSVNAQDRTAALFVAQYQSEGLKTYRDSLAWDNSINQPYSFLDGDTLNSPTTLTGIRNLSTASYWCMNSPTASTPNWAVVTNNASACSAIAKNLAPNLLNPKIEINRQDFSPTTDTSRLLFTIRVIWTARNTGLEESVLNTILLTKQ